MGSNIRYGLSKCKNNSTFECVALAATVDDHFIASESEHSPRSFVRGLSWFSRITCTFIFVRFVGRGWLLFPQRRKTPNPWMFIILIPSRSSSYGKPICCFVVYCLLQLQVTHQGDFRHSLPNVSKSWFLHKRPTATGRKMTVEKFGIHRKLNCCREINVVKSRWETAF